MQIIETCPRCGAELFTIYLLSSLPIPQKLCHKCGWIWTGKPEIEVRTTTWLASAIAVFI